MPRSVYITDDDEKDEDDTPFVRPPPRSVLPSLVRRALNCVCYGNSISCAVHVVIRPQVSDVMDC